MTEKSIDVADYIAGIQEDAPRAAEAIFNNEKRLADLNEKGQVDLAEVAEMLRASVFEVAVALARVELELAQLKKSSGS